MTYSEPVKWDEAQKTIRAKMASQPRGYQAQLAEQLEKTPGYVNQIVVGRRPIPLEHLDVILTSLRLEYDVLLREKA